jgi:hypothetical protein
LNNPHANDLRSGELNLKVSQIVMMGMLIPI